MGLIPCKVCGKEVANSAKTCPHCGAKLRMSTELKVLLIGITGIFGLWIISTIAWNAYDSYMKAHNSEYLQRYINNLNVNQEDVDKAIKNYQDLNK